MKERFQSSRRVTRPVESDATAEREQQLRISLGNERRRAEVAQSRLAAIIEFSHDAIVSKTLGGIVETWNQGAERLFGYRADEVIGQSITLIVPPDRLDEEQEILTRLAAGEVIEHYETVRVAKDGRRIEVSLTVSPIRDSDGRIIGASKVGRDITERKRVEETLRQADRRKDEFLALLAHELRNPLAPLRNGLEIMRIADGDLDVVTQAREMMERQLFHLVRLIDDLVDISCLNRNKIELRRQNVLLADVIGSAVETVRPTIEAGGHDLVISLPQEPIYLFADLTRLVQVFGNLLNNSAKYSNPRGTIWLDAERNGDRVSVSVRDGGIGIPESALPEIFDLFSQVDRSSEENSGGLGVGLALVKGFTEKHGGMVEVESPGRGLGSTFTVHLPALPPPRQPKFEGSGEKGWEGSGSKRRILVVDDNRDSAISLAKMLQLLGNEVRIAHDGMEAVRLAERFGPEAILMDIGMPNLNGYEATRRIRSEPWGRKMRIIALTGWGQDGYRAQSKEAGCSGHLVKPVSLMDLENLLSGL